MTCSWRALFCLVVLPLCLFANSSGWADENGNSVSENKSSLLNKTRLRLVGKVKGRFETSSYTTLTKVDMVVKNVGNVEAKDIEVVAVLPNGSRHKLSGPASLKSYEKGDYTGSPGEIVLSTKKIRAELTCSNCWK